MNLEELLAERLAQIATSGFQMQLDNIKAQRRAAELKAEQDQRHMAEIHERFLQLKAEAERRMGIIEGECVRVVD